MKPALLLAACVLLAAAAPAGDAARGRRIVSAGTNSGALPCAVCHGTKLAGNRSIGAPPIAGLPAGTIVAALGSIAAGKRGRNYVMRNIARSLTPAQRADVAAYLAGLPPAP